MKNFVKVILVLFAATFMLSACAPTKEDAMNYNDKIIQEQKKIVQSEKELISAIKQNLTKGSTLEDLLDELSTQVDASIKVVEELGNLGKDASFKDAAIAFLTTYKDVVDNEYEDWLKNLRTPDELITENVLYEEEELVHAINRKLDKANNLFLDAQKEFATKYDFRLADN